MSAVPAVSDDRSIRARLEVYARYAATLARQEEALAAGDLDLFRELAAVRRELQDAVAAEGDPAPALGDPAPSSRDAEANDEARRAIDETGSAVDETRRLLSDAVAREERIRRRLLEMRSETVESLRDLESRESQVKHYAREDETPVLASEHRRVDIKL